MFSGEEGDWSRRIEPGRESLFLLEADTSLVWTVRIRNSCVGESTDSTELERF